MGSQNTGNGRRQQEMGSIPQYSLSVFPSIFGNHSLSTIIHGVQVMSSPYVVPCSVHVSQAKEESTRNQLWILAGVVDRELVDRGGSLCCNSWGKAQELTQRCHTLSHCQIVFSWTSISKSFPFSSCVSGHMTMCVKIAFSTVHGIVPDMWLNFNQ